jgi:hypothetical protein
MPRTSRRSSALSGALHSRLNSYALAASAAGVGMLASAQPAEAKIVYTPAHKSITPNHTIPLDLNHDGTVDFRLKDIYYTSQFVSHVGILSAVPAVHANEIEGYSKAWHYASALRARVSIGPKGPFKTGARLMARVFSDTGAQRDLSSCGTGPWSKAMNRYLGLKFLIKGKVHFGWARLNVDCSGTDVDATLTGYAYETIPNKPIITGKTEGPDDDDQPAPASRKTRTPEPAMLGMLALGAPGLSIWRREES